jgi:quinol monooxygenase YgiN
LKWPRLSQPSGSRTILLKARLIGTRAGLTKRDAANLGKAAPDLFKPCRTGARANNLTSTVIETSTRTIRHISNYTRHSRRRLTRDDRGQAEGAAAMDQYAINERTISEAVKGGGLLVVAQWEAKPGQADRIADILSRFLPEAQSEPGAKLFLISRAKENPAQFLFYELFGDEAAFKEHQESAHFKTYIAGQAVPLLEKRERAQYALL